MRENYHVMQESIQKGADPDIKSTSGLTGGDAWKLYSVYEKKQSLTGSFMAGAWLASAGCERGSTPPWGASSPRRQQAAAAFCQPPSSPCRRNTASTNTTASWALFTASAVGMVIGNNASLAGASGGCQAECGSASAMAAAAIVELAGGTPQMSGEACAIAIKNILGLVCDPVAGLVEIPCIKRNAGGVTTAFMAAELALAGITSHIPADETILAMKRIGDTMPASLRETAEGGLAMTPTGQALNTRVFGENADAASCSSCRACR